ncbi:MAG: FoF1 ATP synthase subunit a [Candidatus Spechtbacterales bacterium]|nr:FoF1 ATP synthase subunit a [Candidatus Spechtbacterales bacterium]
MNWLQLNREIPSIEPEAVFHIGNFPVTNSFLLTTFILFLFVGLAFYIKRFSIKPTKTQAAIEYIYTGMVDLVDQIVDNKEQSRKIVHLVGALFIFIGVANLIEIIPGISSFQYNGIPVFRSPTTDFNMVLGLGIAMMLLIQLAAIRKLGTLEYLGQYFQVKKVWEGFKEGAGAGAMALTEFFIGLLDIIGELAKVLSLSFRLFGNIYAGQVLAIIILGAVAYGLPAVWLSMSLLFGIVQAIVFGSLVAAYYMIALQSSEE